MHASDLLSRIRKICAAFDGVSEGEAWRHPVFKADGKTFLAIEQIEGRPCIAFRLDRDEVEVLTKDPRFVPTPYGRGLWVSLPVSGRTPWKLVAQLARRSRECVAASPRRARR
jgi:predicted DNA-binding protein (MmcQ/YjbR family)